MYKNWFWWVFSLQPSFTFSYYGRVGAQRHRMRHTGHFTPRPITTSQSLNDLSIIQRHTDRRRLQLSASSVSSEGSSSEGGTDKGGSVRLLWLSMLKVNFFFILLLQHWIMSTEMTDVPVINTACITFTLDAQSALEIMCVSPAHMVLHYSWSCVLYRFHGAGYFPRRPQGIHTSTHMQIPSKSHLYCCWSTTWHHVVFCIPWKPHSSAVDLAHCCDHPERPQSSCMEKYKVKLSWTFCIICHLKAGIPEKVWGPLLYKNRQTAYHILQFMSIRH